MLLMICKACKDRKLCKVQLLKRFVVVETAAVVAVAQICSF